MKQGPHILVVTLLFGIDGGQVPVVHQQSAKRATLGGQIEDRGRFNPGLEVQMVY